MRYAITILLACAALAPAADDGAGKALAAQVLDAMKIRELVTQTMDADFKRGVKPFLAKTPPNQRAAFQRGVDAASEMLRKNLWEMLREDYLALYTSAFTEAELEQLLVFYRSPLGLRLLEQTPALAARTLELNDERMERLLPTLDRIILETMAKARVDDQEKALADVGLVVGKPFPELVLATTDGGTITTSALVGKVVFIDYWATWCGPCVRELPAVLKAYERFHDQGFEVVGISLDEDTARLAEFVAERKLPWKQSCDGKGWESDVAKRFGIDSLPTTFLIARDGTLAAMDLRGEALATAVEQALAAPTP